MAGDNNNDDHDRDAAHFVDIALTPPNSELGVMFFMMILFVYTYAIVGVEIWGLPECGDWYVFDV